MPFSLRTLIVQKQNCIVGDFFFFEIVRRDYVSYSGKTFAIGVRGGGGGGLQPPWNFSNSHIRAKNQVIFGQNHLIFGQAMEEIFGQLTSAPLNETGPVRL